MMFGHSRFEFFSIGVGITRYFATAPKKSTTRRARWSQRIDASAKIQNLTGVGADAARPPIRIAAVFSLERWL